MPDNALVTCQSCGHETKIKIPNEEQNPGFDWDCPQCKAANHVKCKKRMHELRDVEVTKQSTC